MRDDSTHTITYQRGRAWHAANVALRMAATSACDGDVERGESLMRALLARHGYISAREVPPARLRRWARRVRVGDRAAMARMIDAHVADERTWLARWHERAWRDAYRAMLKRADELGALDAIADLTSGDAWLLADVSIAELDAWRSALAAGAPLQWSPLADAELAA